MIVRALDANGDWTFGNGIQNYKSANAAVAQSIQTKLLFFLNDCFFASNIGIDWFNLLGGKNQALLNLQVTMTIQNAPGVLNVVESSFNLVSLTRALSINYVVTTIYSGPSTPIPGSTAYLLTESGAFLDTEAGGRIIL